VGHVYYRKWLDRVGAVFTLVVGAALSTIVWSDLLIPPHNGNLTRLVVSAALLLYGIYLTANAFISTVTLFAGSIEARTAFSRKSLQFSEIRGRREYISGAGRYKTPYFSLVPKDNGLNILAFQQAYNFDEAFFRWFNHLPDLDAADEKMEKD
jgi:hypothetical protein